MSLLYGWHKGKQEITLLTQLFICSSKEGAKDQKSLMALLELKQKIHILAH